MANKEYQIIFQFKAAMDASMGQFSAVKDDLKELRDKAAAMNDAIANYDNYKVFAQNVSEAEARVKELKAAEDAATQTLSAATAARKAAEEAYNSHNLRIAELKAALKDENAEHKATMTLLKEAKATEGEITEEKLRHQIAVQELTKELGEEEIALQRSAQEKKEAARAEKEAETAKRSAAAATKEAENVLKQEQARLEECCEALKKAGIDTKNLEKEIDKLKVGLADVNKELKEGEERQQAFAAMAEGVKKTADVLKAAATGLQLLESAAEPVLDFLLGTVESAATLEKQISAIKAISGATLEEVDVMTQKIREAGATTVFTAEEAAEAMQKMALAGWDAQQMIAGLPAVVNLAAAAGEDLDSMTSIVADGMNAFQLSGERAAIKFADVLAKAATSSNTNVALIGESLSYVETTAGNLGYSIEDVSLALAAMANNALKGSVAGSSLNTTLTRMSGANSSAKAQMEAMGLSMYEANGQAKPLLQFLEELRAAFRNFGDDAQAAQVAAYKLAGQRGMRGLLAIVNQSDEQWQKLTDDIYAYQGASEQISTTRLENYSGKVRLLEDAWTDLKITIGNQLIPTATRAVETLTDMTNGANDLLASSQPLALWAAGTSGAIIGMSKAMSVAASSAQGLKYILDVLSKYNIPLPNILAWAGRAAGIAALAGLIFAVFESDAYQSTLAGTRYLDDLNEKFAETADLSQSSEELFKAAVTPSDKAAAWATIDSNYELEIGDYSEELKAAEEKRDAFIEELKARGHYQFTTDFINGGEVLDINAMTTTEWNSLQAYNDAIDQTKAKITELRKERADYHNALQTQMQEEVGAQSLSLEQYQAIETALGTLAEAWSEVWVETYEAYSGVFGLFEEVETQSADIDEMMSGLQSQSSYWEAYAQNISTLQAAAENANIDLGSLWDMLAGAGDTQSAAYIQEIVDSLGNLEDPDTSKLAELVALYDQVVELRSAAVDVYSENNSDVQAALAQFDEEMKAAIEETESYDEAKSAMLSTLIGYTDALEEESDVVIASVERLGIRLHNAFAAKAGTSIVIKPGSSSDSTQFYASGTSNALPGLAVVGEEGPELVVMRGGEKVIPAGETQRFLSTATEGVSFAPQITIQGNADRGTIDEALEEAERRFKEWFEQMQRRNVRTAY